MGLLDNQTQQEYYQGNNFGDYQFTSLDDIINQFMIVYVGEDKRLYRYDFLTQTILALSPSFLGISQTSKFDFLRNAVSKGVL